MLAYEVCEVTKYYPRQQSPANDNLSLEIAKGEFFGLLGDNGVGKTTLVRQLANLLRPTSGEIRLFGNPLSHAPLYSARQVGYMPQSGRALNNLTVGEALFFTAHLRGLSRHDARGERDRLLEIFEMTTLRHQPTSRLSGGQRRMVALATSMAAAPRVLILDEPTNDLAPQNRIHVWNILRELHTQHGTTIILVTHNVLEAERVIERVGIMKSGRLIAVGRPGALKAGLNHQLRLEIIFTPDDPPALPASAAPHLAAPGRWNLLVSRAEVTAYLDLLNQSPAVEDFRLSTATLEDLYLAMMAEGRA